MRYRLDAIFRASDGTTVVTWAHHYEAGSISTAEAVADRKVQAMNYSKTTATSLRIVYADMIVAERLLMEKNWNRPENLGPMRACCSEL